MKKKTTYEGKQFGDHHQSFLWCRSHWLHHQQVFLGTQNQEVAKKDGDV